VELVYLWVEEYKNIKNQGFNFSPKFECEFKAEYEKGEDGKEKLKDNCELVIKPKEYLENFFGENINITAIVGENGSGKSGILEVFMLTIFKYSNPDSTVFTMRGLCVFQKERVFYYKATPNFSQDSLIQFTNKNPLLKEEIENNSIMMLHYNYSLDMLSSTFKNSIISSEYDGHISDYETTPNNLFSQPKKYNAQINIQQINRETQKYMIKSKQEYGDKSIEKIFFDTFKENRNIQFIPHSFILHFDYANYLEKFTNTSIRKLIKDYFSRQSFNNIDIEKLTRLSYVFFVFQLYSTYTMTPDLFNQTEENFIKNQKLIDILNTINSKNDISHTFINTIIEKFKEIIEDNSLIEMLGIEIQTTFPSIYETAWYIDYIKGNLIILQKHNVKLFHNKTIIDIDLIEKLIKNLPSFIEIELYNKEDISFSDLSFGEKAIIRFSYNMMFFLNFYSKKRKVFFIILDEIDLGLHPEWQRKLFNFILTLTNLLSKKLDIRVTIIVASHSPFILSDLPKENVIFLDTYKEDTTDKSGIEQKKGNCTIVNPNINTFGANIHTLLSNGFFMKDGLMGEFAKEKITEILDYLKNNKPLKSIKEEQVKSIIEKIGEDFLRQKLLNMYNIKFSIKSKDDEIEELKAEIERLNNAQNQA